MNKQEFQQTIKNMKYKKDCGYMSSFEVFLKGFEKAKELALLHSTSLDEPEKPVVPQFVADFYESIKDDFEYKVYELCLQYKHRGDELPQGVAWWFGDSRNKPIETLVMMHKFGYEVEKEKLYTVEIPNPNGGEYGRVFLGKYSSGKIGLHCWTSYKQINFDDSWKKDKIAQLTEAEIKKDFGWAWQFAEEVGE